ncbi:ester cyclase [Sorangium sp. So ce1128]
MTTTDDVERLVRAFLDIASGGGDLDGLDQLLHLDYLGHYPDYEDTVGPEQARQSLAEHRSRFPRRAYTLQAVIATPRSCACNYVMHLWHDAEYMGKAATGQELRFWVSDFFVLEDGRIRERWHQKDKHTIARQLARLNAVSPGS